MASFQIEPMNKAIAQSPYTKAQVAILAGVAELTLDKVLSGEANLMIDSIDRIADYLGLEVVISFKKKAQEAVAA